ncbi:helix-turn-helix domain-containing protein [Paracoccus sp. J56]|uniref:helix-turn-helix domain-containing protein n=1 Tax=Paracoccus sp. J56 TaxID=935850 RepID=UPI001C3910F7|nr:helix-turn-helix domain-containing protein [Paracoccus sp. J56]
MLRTRVGVLAIEGVEVIELGEISGEDAWRAGFDSREALLADIGAGRGGTLYRISFHLAGPDPREALRRNDRLDAEAVSALRDQLAALDKNSRTGPWTAEALRLIGERDGRTAGEIAEHLGIEKPSVKRKIRQLKELGLTESLPSGYRLSDRGRVICKALPQKS